jgi:hypothetical protein
MTPDEVAELRDRGWDDRELFGDPRGGGSLFCRCPEGPCPNPLCCPLEDGPEEDAA